MTTWRLQVLFAISAAVDLAFASFRDQRDHVENHNAFLVQTAVESESGKAMARDRLGLRDDPGNVGQAEQKKDDLMGDIARLQKELKNERKRRLQSKGKKSKDDMGLSVDAEIHVVKAKTAVKRAAKNIKATQELGEEAKSAASEKKKAAKEKQAHEEFADAKENLDDAADHVEEAQSDLDRLPYHDDAVRKAHGSDRSGGAKGGAGAAKIDIKPVGKRQGGGGTDSPVAAGSKERGQGAWRGGAGADDGKGSSRSSDKSSAFGSLLSGVITMACFLPTSL